MVAVGGCRNCGGALTSKPIMRRTGRFRLRGLYLLLAVFTLGVLGILLWPVWPRKSEQTGVLYTCTVCGLQQT
jgi:hypothetical protein